MPERDFTGNRPVRSEAAQSERGTVKETACEGGIHASSSGREERVMEGSAVDWERVTGPKTAPSGREEVV